jgi:Fe-S-cluster containining protein
MLTPDSSTELDTNQSCQKSFDCCSQNRNKIIFLLDLPGKSKKKKLATTKTI